MSTQVFVKSGHVQPVWAGHPWVYAQAIERVAGNPRPGAEVQVLDARGNVLGRGLYSPESAIAVRLYTSEPALPFEEHLELALGAAVRRRARVGLPSTETTAYRLVNGEGDYLPGLTIDCYGDVCALRLGTVGLAERLPQVLSWLTRTLRPRAVVDRSSAEMARKEGFAAQRGPLMGDESLGELCFRERGLEFTLPLSLGQKTGFYLDQRALRERVEALCRDALVLDCHTYVGATALSAARGGARRVDASDTSAAAIAVAERVAEANGLHERVRFQKQDALAALEAAKSNGGYDVVICDPPKLAPNRASGRRAGELMRQLIQRACEATRPGGSLWLSSCSAAMGLPELTRALALGARDAGRRVLVLERLFQGADHPVPAAFPEGLYLSSLVAEVT